MSIEFLNAGLHAADELFNRLDRTFEKEAIIQTDAMFERMWTAKKTAEATRTHREEDISSFKYTSRDYERYGFRSRAKMEAFVTEMQKRGADVAFSTVPINGQYLVEMNRINVVPVKQEDFIPLDDEDTSTEENRNENATETLTAAQLVEEYRLQTFEDVERPLGYKDDDWLAHNDNAEAGSTAQAETSAMKRFMARHMDFFGSSVVKSDNAAKAVDRFGGKYGVKAKIQNETFGAKLKTVTDEETGETRQVADRVHRINGSTGRMKKAVIVGDTVLIDGKIITDSKIRDKVLQQREARISAAERELKRTQSARGHTAIHFDAKNARDNVANNAKAAVQSMKTIARDDAKYVFKSSLVGATAVAGAVTGVGFGAVGAATLSGAAVGAGVLTSSAGGLGKKLAGGFITQEDREAHELAKEKLKGINQERKDSHKQVWSSERDTEDIDRRRANAEQAVKNDAPMEVVSSETVSRAFRKGGLLDEYTNALNTQALLMAYHIEHGIGIIERTLAKTKTKEVSDTAFFERMRILHTNPEAAVMVLDGGIASGTKMPEHIEEPIRETISKVYNGEMTRQEAGKHLKDTLTELIAEEREMLAGATVIVLGDKKVKISSVANDLQKNFGNLGIDFKGGKLTREDLVNVNIEIIKRSETAKVNIIDRNGNVDVKILKSLSDSQKKTLGIDGVAGEMLMELNRKGAWGNFDWNELGFIGSGTSRLAMKMSDGDEDTTKMIQTTQQTASYSKKTVATIKRFHASERKRLDAKNAKKSGKDGKSGKEGKAGKENKQSKNLKDFDSKRAEKGIAVQEKKLTKTNNAENNVFAKARQKKDKIASKVADNPMVKAVSKLKTAATKVFIKALMYVGIAVVVLALILACILLIVMIINSLFNFDFLKPKGYQDTVAYQLMEKVDEHEVQWRDEVENSKDLFDMINKMSFTTEELTASEHLSDIGAMLGTDVTGVLPRIYLSPFGDLVKFYGLNSEYMIELSEINGAITYSYSANVNDYGLKSSTGIDYCTTESGHTDNSKDIVVMADIMFKNNMDEYSDSFMDDTLGMSKRQLWVESAKNFLKVAWHNVKEWWEDVKAGWKDFWGIGSEDEQEYEPDYIKYNGSTYAILETYAIDLFNQTHQQIYTANVEYHTPDQIKMLTDSSGVPIDLEVHEAAALGYCYSPVTKPFPLMLTSTGTIAPYLKDASGNKHRLDTGTYDVTLALNNGTYVDNDTCLATGMGSNAETLNWIKTHMDTSGYSDCWSLNDDGRVKVNGSAVTTGWYDSEEDAKEAAKDMLAANHLGFEIASADSYIWQNGQDTLFKHTYNQKYNYNKNEINYYDLKTQTVDDGVEYRYWYWDEGSYLSGGTGLTTAATAYEAYAIFLLNRSVSGDEWDVTSDIYNLDATEGWHYTDQEGASTLSFHDGAMHWSDARGDHSVTLGENDSYYLLVRYSDCVPKTKTQYKISATAPFYTMNTDNYIRSCKGHDFKYCGGHLGLHCQGITYSITNEQLYLSGAYDTETQYPVVMDADLEAMGYSPLIGKVIKNEVDYNSGAGQASVTGGCEDAGIHIQGSAVAKRGLNLNATGDVWKEEISVRKDVPLFYLRDIFDADCLIDKGNNIFPIEKSDGYKDYEGWTADNMTLAGVKMTTNWTEMYEFDIPYELDGEPIGQQDIDAIVEGLKTAYGSQFTEKREAVVRTALDWVGKFHYSETHKDHNLLSELCKANGTGGQWDASCTAGDDEAFVRFVLERSGRLTNSKSSMYYYPVSGTLLPADVLRHDAGGSLDDISIDTWSWAIHDLDKKLKQHTDESYVIYLGKLTEPLTIGAGDFERTIPAGATLSIDLNNYDNAGTVQLRIKDSTSPTELNSEKSYSWVVKAASYNADDRTKVFKID